MSENKSFSENVWNTLYNSPKYILPGLPAHFMGVAVEMGVITLLQNLPYSKYYRVPVAKIVHESVENFFTSAPNINMFKNGDNFKEAIYNVLNPIYTSPVPLITSMFSSWLFEHLATNIFSLEACEHCVSLKKMEYCVVIVNENSNKRHSWIKGNIIKAIFSSVGSLVPFLVLHQYDKYFSGHKIENIDASDINQLPGECDVIDQSFTSG